MLKADSETVGYPSYYVATELIKALSQASACNGVTMLQQLGGRGLVVTG